MSERSKVEIEIDTAKSILMAMVQDIEAIERYWAPSKRGSNGNRALETLRERRAAALQCLFDAESSP
jgi:hypothetical protein